MDLSLHGPVSRQPVLGQGLEFLGQSSRERPKRGHDLHGHPVGLKVHPELDLPLASYHNQPHAPCRHGCRYPQTKEPIKVRYGHHLVTDCLKANQGNKSHKDVEATIIHHFNIYTSKVLVQVNFSVVRLAVPCAVLVDSRLRRCGRAVSI